MNLSYRVREVVAEHSGGKPTLVFCNSRKSTVATASLLAADLPVPRRPGLGAEGGGLGEAKLRALVTERGVGYHHAGLSLQDRRTLEQVFAAGLLPVLTCTSTLALGVNLPAHLVVIKGTQQYSGGGMTEYSESAVLQMAGRAGRVQFGDTEAVVVIMTKEGTRGKYEAMLEGGQVVESHLAANLFEHLNAEVVLGTIASLAAAEEWLGSTFLHRRGVGACSGLVQGALARMAAPPVGLVALGQGGGVRATPTGRLMSRFYLSFTSMERLSGVLAGEGVELAELLAVLCSCAELADTVLRVNEKKVLNTLNRNKTKDKVRFPLEGRVTRADQKVQVLVQAVLGVLTIPDPGLAFEASQQVKLAQRLATCLAEMVATTVTCRTNLTLVINSHLLVRALASGLWEDSMHVMKQMARVGPVLSTALVAAGLTSFPAVAAASPRQVEAATGRPQPFGDRVVQFARSRPRYRVEVARAARGEGLEVLVSLANRGQVDQGSGGRWLVLVGVRAANMLLASLQGADREVVVEGAVWRRVVVVPPQYQRQPVTVRLVHASVTGVDVAASLQLLPTLAIIPSPSTPDAARTCRHACQDRAACGHACCKGGVRARGGMEGIDELRAQYGARFPSLATPRKQVVDERGGGRREDQKGDGRKVWEEQEVRKDEWEEEDWDALFDSSTPSVKGGEAGGSGEQAGARRVESAAGGWEEGGGWREDDGGWREGVGEWEEVDDGWREKEGGWGGREEETDWEEMLEGSIPSTAGAP